MIVAQVDIVNSGWGSSAVECRTYGARQRSSMPPALPGWAMFRPTALCALVYPQYKN
jgi:hypothetical protein